MKFNNKEMKGITLIALVITIIVLIILAGVSIAILTGDNGILTQAGNAKEKTTKAEALERIQLEIAGSFANNGKYDVDKAVENLERNLGLTVLNGNVTKNNDGTLNVKYKGYEIKVHTDGQVSDANTVEGISADNYGDYINYDVALGIDGDQDGDTTDVDDWRIFYKDNSGNIFIIAADYIPTSKIGGETGMITKGSYIAYWDSPTYTEIDTNVAKLFKFGFDYSNSTSRSNMGAVSNLLNKNAWRRFTTGVSGATAIGGPTLEMYIASWNEKYPDNLLYCNNSTNIGYYVGENDMQKSYCVDMSSKIGYADTLYYPHTTSYNECKGYWLTSPSADYTVNVGDYSYIMTVLYDGYVYGWSNRSNYHLIGVRPLVCLPSGITLTKEDGVWNIY